MAIHRYCLVCHDPLLPRSQLSEAVTPARCTRSGLATLLQAGALPRHGQRAPVLLRFWEKLQVGERVAAFQDVVEDGCHLIQRQRRHCLKWRL